MKKWVRSLASILALCMASMVLAVPSALAAAPEQAKAPIYKDGSLFYDLEGATLGGSTSWSTGGSCANFDGAGYVWFGDGTIEVNLDVPADGAYDITVRAAKDNANGGGVCEKFFINEDTTEYFIKGDGEWPGYEWNIAAVQTVTYEGGETIFTIPEEGFELQEGSNIFTIKTNWSWANYDSITLTPKFQLPESTTATGGSETTTTEKEETTTTEMPTTTEPKSTEPSAIKKVEQAIAALPSTVEEKDLAAVKAAIGAYDALSESEQAAVENAGWLVYARARVRAIEAGDEQKNAMRFEAETGVMEGNTSIVGQDGNMKNFTGDGYVFLFDSKFTVEVTAPQAGQYDVYIIGAGDDGNNKCDYVKINGSESVLTSYLGKDKGVWTASYPGTEEWKDNVLVPAAPENGYTLKAGKNTIEITANWGYSCYDAVVIVPRFNMQVSNGSTPNVATGVGFPAAALVAVGLAGAGLIVSASRRRKIMGELGEK